MAKCNQLTPLTFKGLMKAVPPSVSVYVARPVFVCTKYYSPGVRSVMWSIILPHSA